MSAFVRIAEPEDITNLTELMYEYIVGFYQNPGPPINNVHHLIRTLFDKQQGIQFVVEENGRLVGFATLYFTFSTMKADKIAVMNDLFVTEPYRDTELESQLFLACKNYCINQGYANMTWITSINNTRAQSFFNTMNAFQGKDWVHFSIN
ncbi:GNAT family N-acetyltransferase [Paenibacillus wynnii]|uniref:GNAT family N-acetyltransferase n=1 Tax=Paenibacillus wynnii TaxID=268407 RepID=UPI002790D51D|nr:GNAT family N-acetyltransferase [Paenibacillus wynnii]MDQ0193653.1 N-acetylglutamate synthase-like GNAT family acetyltransferase [Paenibacillus wynnii]